MRCIWGFILMVIIAALGGLATCCLALEARARSYARRWRGGRSTTVFARWAKAGFPAMAGSGMRLSEHAAFTLVETTDIGGTNVASGYVSMKGYDRVMAYVEIGTWNAADDLDTCKLQQDITGGGGDVKDLTGSGAGDDYDTANPVDADGDFVIIEARAEDLDVDGGFKYVRLLLAETGNTGTDNVTAVLIRYGYQYPQKELNGAAVVGSKVYVQP